MKTDISEIDLPNIIKQYMQFFELRTPLFDQEKYFNSKFDEMGRLFMKNDTKSDIETIVSQLNDLFELNPKISGRVFSSAWMLVAFPNVVLSKLPDDMKNDGENYIDNVYFASKYMINNYIEYIRTCEDEKKDNLKIALNEFIHHFSIYDFLGVQERIAELAERYDNISNAINIINKSIEEIEEMDETKYAIGEYEQQINELMRHRNKCVEFGRQLTHFHSNEETEIFMININKITNNFEKTFNKALDDYTYEKMFENSNQLVNSIIDTIEIFTINYNINDKFGGNEQIKNQFEMFKTLISNMNYVSYQQIEHFGDMMIETFGKIYSLFPVKENTDAKNKMNEDWIILKSNIDIMNHHTYVKEMIMLIVNNMRTFNNITLGYSKIMN